MKRLVFILTFLLLTITGFAQATLKVKVDDNKQNYVLGKRSVYVVTVTNLGPADATGVHVVGAIPTNVWTSSWTGPNGSGLINKPLDYTHSAALKKGESLAFILNVDVPANYEADPITGALEVSVVATTTTPGSAQVPAKDLNTIATNTDVVITYEKSDIHYDPTKPITYTVKISNKGPLDATNVTVVNPVPAGYTAFEWEKNGSTAVVGAISETIPLIQAGEIIAYEITGTVPPKFNGTLTNVANVMVNGVSDVNTANNTNITDVKTLLVGADVVVTCTDNVIKYGATPASYTLTYVVTVKNNGPVAATDVKVTGSIPAGTTGTVWREGASTIPANPLIPTLNVGQTKSYTVTVTVQSGYTSPIVHTVSVTSTTNDPYPNNNSVVDTDYFHTDLNSFADLVVTKTDNKERYLLNSSTIYTIVVTNFGPAIAKNVVVTDIMPLNIERMYWSGNGKSGDGDLIDTVSELNVGESIVYTVTISVPNSYEVNLGNGEVTKDLVNKVVVTSDTPDESQATISDTNRPSADYVTIDTDKYTVEQLVTQVLITAPCVNISNFTSSEKCGFGYFHRNNSNFPIKEGMIIRGGDAKKTEGKWDFSGDSAILNSISTRCTYKDENNPGKDLDLQAAIPGTNVKDASFVKFSFVAGSDRFSFRYLFASNEYGIFQCQYFDPFAFLLEDVTPGFPKTAAVNLAIVPGTQNTPVSVLSIRDNKYNTNCSSENVNFFGQFNADPKVVSAIKMTGQTKVMTASATGLIPGHTYSIKMVIGDDKDAAYDATVFIEAGSFDLGNPEIQGTNEYLGMTDFPFCGEPMTILAGKSKRFGATYTWKKDGVVIPGADDWTLVIESEGLYTVVVKDNFGCEQSDDIRIQLAGVPLAEPNTLTECGVSQPTFDLTSNESVVLGNESPSGYFFYYYHTEQDALDFAPVTIIDEENPDGTLKYDITNYPGKNGEKIWMRIITNSGCIYVKSFELAIVSQGGEMNYGDEVCRNLPSYPVTRTPDFPLGGVFTSSSPDLIVNPQSGTLDTTKTPPGNYEVTYVLSVNGCLFEKKAPVKVVMCASMQPTTPVCPGGDFTLEARDEGTEVEYNWYNSADILIATTPVPSYSGIAPSSSGMYKYSVVATYIGGVSPVNSLPSSKDLEVRVVPDPVILGENPTSVCEGSSKTLTLSGVAQDGVKYQWRLNGVDIPGVEGQQFSYVIDNATAADAGNYICIVSLSGCSKTSEPLVLSVISAPTGSVTTGLTDTICEGEATDLIFAGTPGASVFYSVNGLGSKTVLLNANNQSKIISTGALKETSVFKILKVVAGGSAGCTSFPVSSAVITVNPLPRPILQSKGYICVDPVNGATIRNYKIDTQLDAAQYSFVWFKEDVLLAGASESFYDADAIGEYKVLITDKTTNCTRLSIVLIDKSIPPSKVTAEVLTEYFEDNAIVVISATPVGDYEYQLDNGSFQKSNRFEGVSYGKHVVNVRDAQACDVLSANFTVINFPRYFTPNGDGINDTWNISSIEDEPNAKIYIFDRFGQLLKQITPSEAGWDGFYNGNPMPADDYWFVIKYFENQTEKEFKSHFSLKR